jgi:hypothetical protein
MHSPIRGARWAVVAVALVFASQTAVADKHKRRVKVRESVAACTSFDQVDRADDSLDFVVGNTCDVAVACSVSWTVICAPETKAARRHQHGQAFSLATAQTQSTNADAGTCGSQAWAIDNIVWACQPEAPAD